MKTFLKWIIFLALLGGIGTAAYFPASKFLAERNRPLFRTQAVIEGEVTLVVNATGEVKPVQRVSIGSVVSGPVEKIYVDFNDPVKKDQILARIDARLYQSAKLRDEAILKTRKAEVERANSQLQQAVNAEKRASDLQKINPDFISESEIDELQFKRMALEADLIVSRTAVETAQANLDNSIANLTYTEIRAPVDGMIIDRKVDPGQTLAAQFQTPELFVVAPELDKQVHIFASVDEADIGLIRKAKEEGQPVRFTVDAYPDELFETGKILQVRLSSTEEQNVVTYPVIVETPNPDVKLLPGMTANLSFQIAQKSKAVKIPNAALRFYPDRKWVHPDDRKILDGVADASEATTDTAPTNQSAEEKFQSNQARTTRFVWIQDNGLLRARKVKIGISDSRYSEMIEGEVKVGEELVFGEKPKEY